MGRTGRMGAAGEALLFLLPSEKAYADLLRQQGVSLQVGSVEGHWKCLQGKRRAVPTLLSVAQ